MNPHDLLTQLGLRYRQERIKQKIKLSTLAVRCGISIDTLRAIEQGNDRVRIGSWLTVAQALDLASPWQGLLAVEIDPFEEYDRQRELKENLKKTRVRS
jgi:transcriptional regulator with XRE-family HTH domain